MTSESSAAAITATAPEVLPSGVRWRIFLYLSVLIFLLAFGAPNGGLIEVPITFFLKNKLHMSAQEVAQFRLLAGLPLYLSWIFGFARDMWNPLGRRDRGFMMLFGAAGAVLYALFAFIPVSHTTLLLALFLLTASFLFVLGAQNGLTATLGQQHVMSGQLSAAWNIVSSLPVVVAFIFGGSFSELLETQHPDAAARNLFLVGAGAMALVALYAAWRPAVVFDNVRPERGPKVQPLADLKRLARHWPVYPALLVWFLWNFAPGSATPLQYYLQNTLHASDADWGRWNGIFAVSFIPTFLLYGYLCRRYPLRPLLFWGTVAGVPQMVPLLFLPSVTAALVAAVPIGLMGGLASAAYYDLIIRSCPRALQGTTLMLAASLYYIAARFGDLLGTVLYDHYGGFTVCVLAITAVYALILPLLLLVPSRLTATADGERLARGYGEE
jgi:MFS family permease